MLPQKLQLILIMPRNHSIDTTLSSTDLRHIPVELNSASPPEILVSDMIELGNNKESAIPIIYKQQQVKNDQTQQEAHKNTNQNPTMETSTIITNFISPQYHALNNPHKI